jgi:hypothetical protein
MSHRKVEPASRHGVWISHHNTYGQAALLALDKLVARAQEVEQKEQELRSEGTDPGYVTYLLSPDRDECHVLAVTTEIYCCMAIEAFLNFYGVVRLGEEFYKRNCERLGITEKLEILLAACENVLLEKGSEISRLLRKMFDRRNSLVHPKTKELTHLSLEQELSRSVDIVAEARQRVDELKRFVTLFAEYDEAALRLADVH